MRNHLKKFAPRATTGAVVDIEVGDTPRNRQERRALAKQKRKAKEASK